MKDVEKTDGKAQKIITRETEPCLRKQDFKPADIVYDRSLFPLSGSVEDRMAFVIEQREGWGKDGPVLAKEARIQTGESRETVASVNPEYPGDDHVYTVAFISALERDSIGFCQWSPPDDNEKYSDYLRDLNDDWSIGIQTYDYPESRLYHAGHLELPGCRFENDQRTSTDYVHSVLTGGAGKERAHFNTE